MELLASGLEQRPLVTRRWKVGGADFHEYRNGLISRLRIGFNLVEASQQLQARLTYSGVVPCHATGACSRGGGP